jgi:hypothetical protein
MNAGRTQRKVRCESRVCAGFSAASPTRTAQKQIGSQEAAVAPNEFGPVEEERDGQEKEKRYSRGKGVITSTQLARPATHDYL